MGKKAEERAKEREIYESCWHKMDGNIRKYCEDYSVQKIKRDFAKTIWIIIALFILFLVTFVLRGFKNLNTFDITLAAIAVISGIGTYSMSLKYKKTFNSVVMSPDAEYAIAQLKDYQYSYDQAPPSMMDVLKHKDTETVASYTLGFKSVEVRLNGLIPGAKIGDRILLVKRDTNPKLESGTCFKMVYSGAYIDDNNKVEDDIVL